MEHARTGGQTYKSKLVEVVVCDFELLERDELFFPDGSGSRGVWVDVESSGEVWLGFSCHHPLGVVKLVTVVVNCNNVHDDEVFGVWFKTRNTHFNNREHTPREREREKERRLNTIDYQPTILVYTLSCPSLWNCANSIIKIY